ncbi:glycosyltransferase [uncultured Clostridium sp.]|uniref:glycosyltransferase n=1 Tax=uncultured Clostridium sp. TaxID=59620 RepID=UPI0025D2A567|nr:glycosyltransferase [uncultured Clostridium sp.]
MKKIVFVAHEFGLYPGHGGIASYLYQLVSLILKMYSNEYEVYILASVFDKDCELLKESNFHIYKIIEGNYNQQGLSVLKILKSIKPNYVEVAEFLGLGLESLLYRSEYGNELENTIFITNNHTASRECFEWSSKLPISLAPYHIQEAHQREKLQMVLSDMNESPSNFLSKYVAKNYCLSSVETMRHPVDIKIESKDALVHDVDATIDTSRYKDKFVISCISRVEGRKNQNGLVNAFIEFCKKTKSNSILILAGNSSINAITGQDEKLELYKNIPPEYRSNIEIYDFMGKKGKKMISSISDVAVLASPFENFPVAMTEYVYQGIPVIASIYSGCYDFMSGCELITAFNPFRENQLEESIEKFYKLGKSERKKIANIQLENLKKLVDPENSVKFKLDTYSKVKNKSKEIVNEVNDILYINEKNIFNSISNELIKTKVNIVLGIDEKHSDELENCFEKLISNINGKAAIAVGNMDIDYDIQGALINNKVLVLKDIIIEEKDVNRMMFQFIADELIKLNFYYIPIYNIYGENNSKKKQSKEKNSTYVDICKVLLNEIFYKKNAINLEEYI